MNFYPKLLIFACFWSFLSSLSSSSSSSLLSFQPLYFVACAKHCFFKKRTKLLKLGEVFPNTICSFVLSLPLPGSQGSILSRTSYSPSGPFSLEKAIASKKWWTMWGVHLQKILKWHKFSSTFPHSNSHLSLPVQCLQRGGGGGHNHVRRHHMPLYLSSNSLFRSLSNFDSRPARPSATKIWTKSLKNHSWPHQSTPRMHTTHTPKWSLKVQWIQGRGT